MSDTPTSTPSARRKLIDHPVSRIAAIVLPAIVSGLVSSYKAHEEAKVKIAESRAQAEAGYEAVVQAMHALEMKNDDALNRIAKLEGQVQILAQHLDKHTSEWVPVKPKHTRIDAAPSSATAALATVKAPSAPRAFMRLPDNLEQAVQQRSSF